MNSDCYRAETGRIRLPRQNSPTKPTSWRPALGARPGFELWYGRRQRLNPARGKGAMSSDAAGDCLQLSPAENPLPPLSFRDLHSARPGRPFRKSGTGGSNPVPSSGQSVSHGKQRAAVENPGFSRGCAGHERWCGRQRLARPATWRVPVAMSLPGQIPVPQCQGCGPRWLQLLPSEAGLAQPVKRSPAPSVAHAR